MADRIVFTGDAEDDLFTTFVWYESQRTGLGEEYLACIEACVESIRRFPQRHPAIHKAYKRALVRRFPYAIFYKAGEQAIEIRAVFHTSRDPKDWQERLS